MIADGASAYYRLGESTGTAASTTRPASTTPPPAPASPAAPPVRSATSGHGVDLRRHVERRRLSTHAPIPRPEHLHRRGVDQDHHHHRRQDHRLRRQRAPATPAATTGTSTWTTPAASPSASTRAQSQTLNSADGLQRRSVAPRRRLAGLGRHAALRRRRSSSARAPTPPSGQAYTGYWRVGGDNLGGWPNQPSEQLLHRLDRRRRDLPDRARPQQVRDALHRQRPHARRCRPHRPTPTAAAVYNREPDLYWRLDETTGTDRSGLRHQPATTGTYSGGVPSVPPAASTGTSNKAGDLQRLERCVVAEQRSWSPTRRSTPRRRGSRPPRPAAASSSASAATQTGHVRQLRPARLHGGRRPADLRHLDRLSRHRPRHRGLQRRQVAPGGRHAVGATA